MVVDALYRTQEARRQCGMIDDHPQENLASHATSPSQLQNHSPSSEPHDSDRHPQVADRGKKSNNNSVIM